MADQLKATVASISRFHSFELARQLQARNALAAIYTGLAKRFVRRYGIEEDLLHSFPWVQVPLEIAQRFDLLSPGMTRRIGHLAHRALDRHVARKLPACHVYMALAGIGLESGRAAQARGTAYVCDRSSAHIEVQKRLLTDAYAALDLPYTPIDSYSVERNLAEYDQADMVVVPSQFAYDSFVESGFPAERLCRIPFGVPGPVRRCARRSERSAFPAAGLFPGRAAGRAPGHCRSRGARNRHPAETLSRRGYRSRRTGFP